MWKFKELGPGDVRRTPHEFEFFRRMKNITEAFVREVIQNSLDAKLPSSQEVVIIFTFGEIEREIEKYLDRDFKSRLQISKTIEEEFNWNNGRFLVVEDFGTSGLDGSLTVPQEGEKSNFYNFFWDEGGSEKRESKVGRWGLGKTTIFMVSKIKTFWGVTLRSDDGQELLMGKVLFKKPYFYQNRWFKYYGYFVENEYRPISSQEIIQDFKRIFLIKRNNEPGLSLIIPFLIEELTPELILKSVIIHYFYPVAKGILRVVINEREINKNNLKEIVKSFNWKETSWEGLNVKEILDFIYKCLSIEKRNFIYVSLPDPANPKIEDIKEDIFENFDNIKEKFSNGETMVFEFPLKIKRKKPLTLIYDPQRISEELRPKDTHFLIYLKKDNSLTEPIEFWIRAGVRITDIKTLSRPVLGMMVAEDETIVSFLGDAETPAHTDWEEKNEEFKKNYNKAEDILKFIKKSMKTLVSILDEPPKHKSKIWEDLFSIPLAEKGKNRSQKKSKEIGPIEREPIFKLEPITEEGGFKLTLRENLEDISFPFFALVKIAYHRKRGRHFDELSCYDFTIGELPKEIKEGEIVEMDEKERFIKVKINSKEFNLKIWGFDKKRDLYVVVEKVK